MTIKSKYDIGEIVYLVTDQEQLPRMITGIQLGVSAMIYRMVQGTNETWHYEIEICSERDVLKALSAKD